MYDLCFVVQVEFEQVVCGFFVYFDFYCFDEGVYCCCGVGEVIVFGVVGVYCYLGYGGVGVFGGYVYVVVELFFVQWVDVFYFVVGIDFVYQCGQQFLYQVVFVQVLVVGLVFECLC